MSPSRQSLAPQTTAKAAVEKVVGIVNRPSGQDIIATLSFPLRERSEEERDKNIEKKQYTPIYNNADLISELILKRQPEILLCAGWTLASDDELKIVKKATDGCKTIVILESWADNRWSSWQVQSGESYPMGFQCFSQRKNANKRSLDILNQQINKRKFSFLDKQGLLLICGEIAILRTERGTLLTNFHEYAGVDTIKSIRKDGIFIFNPTHTRMGQYNRLNPKRLFLSHGQNQYFSSSNWVCVKDHFDLSPTFHTHWKNGKSQNPAKKIVSEYFHYREWII